MPANECLDLGQQPLWIPDDFKMTFTAHRARKRFGQHWLIDQTVLARIVAAAELEASDRVLEVGPGRGALSERLLATPAAAVAAVELDRDLVLGLQERFGDQPRFQLTYHQIYANTCGAITLGRLGSGTGVNLPRSLDHHKTGQQ